MWLSESQIPRVQACGLAGATDHSGSDWNHTGSRNRPAGRSRNGPAGRSRNTPRDKSGDRPGAAPGIHLGMDPGVDSWAC